MWNAKRWGVTNVRVKILFYNFIKNNYLSWRALDVQKRVYFFIGGNPASFANSATANAEKGVWLAGLTTVVHPTARAAAHFRVIIEFGKFHGVMEAATPIGCLSTVMRLSRW